jgi:hypothetical protein
MEMANLLLSFYSKRNSTQKAWTTGVNPLTKASQPTRALQQNGAPTIGKPAAAPKPLPSISKESNTPEYHASDRIFYLFAHLVVRTSMIRSFPELKLFKSLCRYIHATGYADILDRVSGSQ